MNLRALHAELLKVAEEKVAIDPSTLKMLLAGAGGAALGAVPAALLTHHSDEAAREQTRNRAFGAGVATGVAGPRMIQGLYNIAQRTGFLPPQSIQGTL